jgi:hemerythrin-like domain-containing protein
MVGNPMDNACKWARSQVMIRALKTDENLLITVEDDGPGIPKARRRLDESRSGHEPERVRQAEGSYPGMAKAIEIIQREHRNVSAVLHCLDSVLRDIATRGTKPDFQLLDEIFRYLSSFLFRFHHPKEDLHLFSALRLHCPEAVEVLDELEEEHRHGDELIENCRNALHDYRRGSAAAFSALREATEAYLDLEATHILKEEREIIPLAERTLVADDWTEIDTAFTDHNDPLFGNDCSAQFQRLLTNIAQLAPLPHGREIADSWP